MATEGLVVWRAGAYADPRWALDDEDEGQAQAAVLDLLRGGKSLKDTGRAVGIVEGTVKPELFTGSKKKKLGFVARLTSEQRETSKRVFRERKEAAQLSRQVAFRPEV